MTRPTDDSPVHPDRPGRPVAAVHRILDLVVRARTRADGLDVENIRADVIRADVTVLVFDLDIALDHAVTLAGAPDLDGVLTLTRDLDRVLDLELDRECEQQRGIVGDIRSARARCEHLAVTLTDTGRGTTATGETTEQQPGRLALEMTRVAVRMLPGRHRFRYYEEFRAELAEQSRSAQLGYALRLLTRCRQLRRALADAVPAPKPGR